MNTKFRIFRVISCLLTILILGQSCTIYRSANISVDEAIQSGNRVKVKTTQDQSYTFKRIGHDEMGIYGIAPKNSRTSRQLNNDILLEIPEENVVKIQLRESSIEEINPRNKTLSIMVPLLTVAVGVAIFAATYSVSASPW